MRENSVAISGSDCQSGVVTKFLASGRRRDLLVLVYSLGNPREQELKRELEVHYEERLSPGEFYGSLDQLVENGFLTKSVDGVHDRYELTAAGRDALLEHVRWLETQMENRD